MKLRLLTLSSLRFYRRHPWQLLLAVLGIALGVAVFLGIELANGSARRAFDASSTAALDQTTHRLLPVAGRLPMARYLALKRDRRFVDSAPVLELPVTLALPGRPAFDLTLEGIDPIEERAVRGLRGRGGEGDEAEREGGERAEARVKRARAVRCRGAHVNCPFSRARRRAAGGGGGR